MENHYSALGILPTASTEEIKEAYSRARAKLMTSGLTDAELNPSLTALDHAYVILSDSSERANYDRALEASPSLSSPTGLMLLERPATLVRPETPTPVIQQPCPYCGMPNPIQASMCIQCSQQISRPCPSCGQAVQLAQNVCPRCNTFLPEYDQRRVAQAIITEQKTHIGRRESDAKVQALEAGHRVRAIQGMIFWSLVMLGCIALIVIPILVYKYVINNP